MKVSYQQLMLIFNINPAKLKNYDLLKVIPDSVRCLWRGDEEYFLKGYKFVKKPSGEIQVFDITPTLRYRRVTDQEELELIDEVVKRIYQKFYK